MTRHQPSRISSPWSFRYRVRILFFEITWTLFCSWTPKPFNVYRIFILRLFGAKIDYSAFVHQRARIAHPWNLVMAAGSCLGDCAHAYCLAPITLRTGSTAAQEAYLCTASHDFTNSSFPLITAPIVLEEDAFIGARAFVLPGVTIGCRTIVGACAVVTRSIAPDQIVAGNPARSTRKSS